MLHLEGVGGLNEQVGRILILVIATAEEAKSSSGAGERSFCLHVPKKERQSVCTHEGIVAGEGQCKQYAGGTGPYSLKQSARILRHICGRRYRLLYNKNTLREWSADGESDTVARFAVGCRVHEERS